MQILKRQREKVILGKCSKGLKSGSSVRENIRPSWSTLLIRKIKKIKIWLSHTINLVSIHFKEHGQVKKQIRTKP